MWAEQRLVTVGNAEDCGSAGLGMPRLGSHRVKGGCMCHPCSGTQLPAPKCQAKPSQAKRLSQDGRTQGEKGLYTGFQQTSLWPATTAWIRRTTKTYRGSEDKTQQAGCPVSAMSRVSTHKQPWDYSFCQCPKVPASAEFSRKHQWDSKAKPSERPSVA